MFVEYLIGKDFLKRKGFKSYEEYSKCNIENKDSDESMFDFEYPSPFLIEMSPSDKYLKRKKYYKDTIYIDHPILNISKEQAIDFCQWRTEVVKNLWFSQKSDERKRDLSTKILYRLPSESELFDAKTWFKRTNQLTNFKDKKLLKTYFSYHPKGYRVLPIFEFTKSEKLSINEGINNKNFIGFRCVCEIHK